MRSGIMSSLCAFLVLACCAPRAASQLTSLLPLPVQARQGEPTPAPKISQDQLRQAIHHPYRTYSADYLATPPQITAPPAGKLQGGTIRVLPSEGTTHSCCAHVLIFRPSPDLDPKIVLRVPGNLIPFMPTFRGLYPCPQDYRGLLVPSSPLNKLEP